MSPERNGKSGGFFLFTGKPPKGNKRPRGCVMPVSYPHLDVYKSQAFGPVFPGEENHLHDADEFIEIEKFMLHAQICLEAMFRMATQK